jgi:hypothetical protein
MSLLVSEIVKSQKRPFILILIYIILNKITNDKGALIYRQQVFLF